jgi:type IV pilus assembly protein PilB
MRLNENFAYNVLTIEDPVEFQLEGANQMQVQKATDFTFAEGLKTILRLSPDIILVGEIRDKETAKIAVESGLTGQLVLTSLHAEDAVGGLFRMLDLGIESYLLNSSLSGVIAQRLVRILCPNCRAQTEPTEADIDLYTKILGRNPQQLFKPVGCAACGNLGFKGRIGIFELLTVNAQVRNMIRDKANETELRDSITKQGFISLLRDGLEKAEQGVTTVEEVLRNGLRSF